MKPIPLYEMFPFVKETNRLATDYTGARVVSVTINNAKTAMKLVVTLSTTAPPYELNLIEEMISNEFGIEKVTISASYVQTEGQMTNTGKGANAKSALTFPGNHARLTGNTEPTPALHIPPENSTNEPPPRPNFKPPPRTNLRPIMGRATKVKPTPMSEVTIDLGRVTVKGEVNAVRSRHFDKGDAWQINFDITDYTGTVNVAKFMREKNDDKKTEKRGEKIANAIKKGMFLTVTGTLDLDKHNELILNPINIVPYEKEHRLDAAKEKRIELHLHTKMSAMDALTDTEEAITRAAEWGHPAIAITDHGVVHSFPAAAKAAKNLDGKIKIIYGVEGYLRNDVKEKRKRNYHIILLVKNQTGLTNLYKLVTKSHLEHYDRRPIIYRSMLEEHKDGLIIGSACEAGELFGAIVDRREESEVRKIAELYDYLEIMPVCNNNFMLLSQNPKAKNEDELRDFNRKIVELGRALNKPVVATGDVHFLDPEHEVYRHILQTSRGYSGATNDLPLYFKTTDEMLEEFSYLGEETAYKVVVKNPRLIADMCQTMSPLPPEEQLFPPKLDGSAEELRKLVSDKLAEVYGENPPEIVTSRKDYELNDILTLNYDVIYMAAQKLVSYLREQKSRVGSRGSVGSSLVAYLAGITEVNPLPAHYRCPGCKITEFPRTHAPGADMPDKPCPACGATYIKDGFNIPFETFMGFAGKKVPDIDLN
ncbi:MAG: PHP domain-containing protein, partial [Oscillospiraceae bacterium]|nr:PHP domain-containing protein [Oscillospiraceae bacterium]